MASASSSRKRSRQGQDDDDDDNDEVALDSQREEAVDLGGVGVKGAGRVKHDGHEAAASKGWIDGQPSGQKNSLGFVDPLPKLIVLDLDKTLWPFYCHEQTTGPYSRLGDKGCAVKCRSLQGAEKVVRLFPQVLDLVTCLKQQGSIRLAVASRSPIEGAARGILGALGMLDMFCCLEIRRGSKATHFKNISAATGVAYRDMLFFDDDELNVKTVSKLGASCVEVSKDSGLTFAAVRAGFKKYREVCLSRSRMRAWLQPQPLPPKVDKKEAEQLRSPDGELKCALK